MDYFTATRTKENMLGLNLTTERDFSNALHLTSAICGSLGVVEMSKDIWAKAIAMEQQRLGRVRSVKGIKVALSGWGYDGEGSSEVLQR